MNNWKNTYQVLNEFGLELIAKYKDKLAQQDYTEGELFKTIKLEGIKYRNGIFNIEINIADYWKYIEYGRRAGAKMPPVNVIEKWITKKNIIPRPITLKSGKQVIPTTKSLAFVIARSIGIKGIKPRPYLNDSLDEIRLNLIDKLKDSITKDLADIQ
jgi:hypothetical protein